ncbi:MAG TPA: hypothetical protein VN369_00815, partial [Terriglobales bacterium]|nr:hypothetical protein [Terriglobales bacterium]
QARTGITPKRFLLAMSLGSFPNIFILCAVGNQILEGEFLLAGVLLGSVFLLMTLTWFSRDRLIRFAMNHGKRPPVPEAPEVQGPGDGKR